MKISAGDPGSIRMVVYLDGRKVPYCVSADEETGLVELLVDENDGGGRTHFARGQVEIRLVPEITAEAHAWIEAHYGRKFRRDEAEAPAEPQA